MVRPQIWPPCDVNQACAHDAGCTGHGKGSYPAYMCGIVLSSDDDADDDDDDDDVFA